MMYGKPTTSSNSSPDAPDSPPRTVLWWCFSKRTAPSISVEQVTKFHAELAECAQLVGAKSLEVGATYGAFECTNIKASSVSASDSAVRLGQLLCRWATVQEPKLELHAGVAMGQLHSFTLAGARAGLPGYWGTALTSAKELAELAPGLGAGENCVHINASTRGSLHLFERLPFSVTGEDSYFLNPWVEAVDTDGFLDPQEALPSPTARAPSLASERTLSNAEAAESLARLRDNKMNQEEFVEFLRYMNVDVSKFGKGQATTVEHFMEDMANAKCYLRLVGAKLERRVEIVRISLMKQGSDGVDRTLKLGIEIMVDGRARTRNQKLAVTIVQGQTWKEAVARMFDSKFGLSSECFDENFLIQDSWVKEEVLYSPSVPGIKTVYLTTEVRMRVRDIVSPEQQKLGLPAMESFTTRHEGKTSHWSWKGPDEALSNADMLTQLLQDHHISVADIGDQAFQTLVTEVYEDKMSTLAVSRGEAPELLRHLHVVKIWITAEILSVPHVLVMRSKMQWGSTTKYTTSEKPLSMRMSSSQSWEQAVTLAVTQRLGLDYYTQKECLVVDPHSYKQTEEVRYSDSYPGLKTIYRIHQVAMQAKGVEKLGSLGLPEGTDFVINRQESNRIVQKFGWTPADDCESFVHELPAFTRRMTRGEYAKEYRRNLVDNPVKRHMSGTLEPDRKRRVQAPEPVGVPARGSWKSSYAVAEVMRGKTTDWTRARNAAKRIRDPDYNVGMFFDDCVAAFPELQLYQVDSATSSGRSGDDEYQRTVGALFAVFWLMRLHLDGGQSFAFGVSDEWLALSGTSEIPRRKSAEIKQRAGFLDGVNWSLFDETLVSAGMLKGPPGSRVHDEGRVLAMLVLTAIHDVMKVEALLPVVDAKVGGFSGYKAGERITDHDVALGYILEHVPDALPSYAGLPKEQQAPVKFTQCSMDYNMGHLVQAEAPPGPLFSNFRQIIRSGGASPADISFYFVHWLTDLAGAEPCPIEGCEKFVLKFPQRVLTTFLGSFDYVRRLNSQTECQVYEEYLQWRWRDHDGKIGPLEPGKGSVAKLRLAVMAQNHASEVLEAHERLPEEALDIIDAELARTGCRGQSYTVDGGHGRPGGPAFLVYYGPALLGKHIAGGHPYAALMVLAEVLKQARSLWPVEEAAADTSVTVYVDSIKDADLEALTNLPVGQCWALHRTNAKEAMVKKLNLMGEDGSLAEAADRGSHRVLKFKDVSPPRVAIWRGQFRRTKHSGMFFGAGSDDGEHDKLVPGDPGDTSPQPSRCCSFLGVRARAVR